MLSYQIVKLNFIKLIMHLISKYGRICKSDGILVCIFMIADQEFRVNTSWQK